ncbi:hypothetical protein SPRG_07464 [Saprolegnia parasitica CBS 223.65]|uniref:Uncharacterized protein n=1 Tax=Saprolegnia parasitica (strain CBS 223.65) TaxID=695850 RepID=A0A067CDJ4_SAPPC|nr:hypothetical protein SPRG_07464 [Saprolegnia parasitica CBS 223.65]KDO27215.1 hypothetical protein SPRG_07464 [Saprolegnia parasitica CBS 223.65]|eukprot:XP_012201993.1 hypothetical protein SPRG_07464 [Saprolegnia parasitica CBS 223.65]
MAAPSATTLLLAAHRGVPGLMAYIDDHAGYAHAVLALVLEASLQTQVPLRRKRDMWSALLLQQPTLRFIDAATRKSTLATLRSLDADAYVLVLAQMALCPDDAVPDDGMRLEPADGLVVAPLFQCKAVPATDDALEMDNNADDADRAASKRPRLDTNSPECIEIDLDDDEVNPLDLLSFKMQAQEHAGIDASLQQETDSAVDAPPAAIELTPEHQAKVALLLKAIGRLTGHVAGEVASVCDDILSLCLDITMGPEPIMAKLEVLGDKLQLDTLPDEALVVFCSKLLDAQWSLRASMHLVAISLFRNVMASPNAISRGLVQVLSRLASDHASVVIEQLLVPIMTSPDLSEKAPQCEIVTRLLRDGLHASHIDALVQRVVADRQASPFMTSDRMLLVLQTLFNLKAALSQRTIDGVVDAMQAALSRHTKSVKFATVLFTVVSKYPTLCSPHRETLFEIGSGCHSSMAKTALRAIEKLT